MHSPLTVSEALATHAGLIHPFVLQNIGGFALLDPQPLDEPIVAHNGVAYDQVSAQAYTGCKINTDPSFGLELQPKLVVFTPLLSIMAHRPPEQQDPTAHRVVRVAFDPFGLSVQRLEELSPNATDDRPTLTDPTLIGAVMRPRLLQVVSTRFDHTPLYTLKPGVVELNASGKQQEGHRNLRLAAKIITAFGVALAKAEP